MSILEVSNAKCTCHVDTDGHVMDCLNNLSNNIAQIAVSSADGPVCQENVEDMLNDGLDSHLSGKFH